jgi:hypothetical protein
MAKLKRPSNKDLEKTIDTTIDWFFEHDDNEIKKYVSKLREQNEGISDEDLAKKIVRRKSYKNGLIGAATGIPGFLALPVTVPADIIASWKIQINMAICIAHAFGHDNETTDLKTDVYIIIAGDAAKEALKRFGIEVSKAITKKAVDRYVTREAMKQIWKVVGRKIITKAGEKSIMSFTKLIPLVGAPVGFAFDWAAAQIVGKHAVNYYKG